MSEKNKPFNTIDNAVLILNNDPLFAGNIKDNLFRERIELDGNMPWSRSYVDVTDKDDPKYWEHFFANTKDVSLQE